MDCDLPVSSVHGILQTRILEWVAIPFSRIASWSNLISHFAGRFLTVWATRLAIMCPYNLLFSGPKIYTLFSNSIYWWFKFPHFSENTFICLCFSNNECLELNTESQMWLDQYKVQCNYYLPSSRKYRFLKVIHITNRNFKKEKFYSAGHVCSRHSKSMCECS